MHFTKLSTAVLRPISSLVLAASLLLAVLFGSAFGAQLENICKDAKAQPLTPPILSGPLNQTELPKCDERSLYYGFGSKPDYPAALQCGWYERQHPERAGNTANMFYGVGVLSMLYANGQGVARNYDLAVRFACEQPWAAPAEMSGRVEHLLALRDGKPAKSPFDLCDDTTSGLSAGSCASVAEDSKDADRTKKLAAITSKLTPAQKQLYDRVYSAESKFEDTRVRNEIDLSGTARAAFQLEDLGLLRDQFLINLERFSGSNIPQATADDVKNLDAQMNAAYQRVMTAPESAFQSGTVKREGVRETQRDWLPLRDSWVAFARAAYPRLSPDRVMAQLIRLRLHQLQALPINLK